MFMDFKKVLSLLAVIFILFNCSLAIAQGEIVISKEEAKKLLPAITLGNDKIIEVQPEEYMQAVKQMKEREVSLETFLDMRKTHENLVIIDTRSKNSFDYKHIDGAINISPENMITEVLEEKIPNKDVPIVVYCDNSIYLTRMVALTTMSFPTLYTMGYKNLYILRAWGMEGQTGIPDPETIEKRLNMVPTIKQ